MIKTYSIYDKNKFKKFMAEENTISNLMISHHVLLEVLFTLFRDEAKEKFPKHEAALGELIWETRKHFFL